MGNRMKSSPAQICSLLVAWIALVAFMVPAFGADKDVIRADAQPAIDSEEYAEFFDKLPPNLKEVYAPAAGTQASADKSGATVTDRLQAVIRPRPVPELAQPIITGVTFDGGVPTVEFQVIDEFGIGIDGFVQEENVEFGFTVNKLVPGSGGETSNWQAYVLAADEGVENAQPGTFTEGTLEDLGDGNYRFTFAEDVGSISGVLFEPELTHRVGVEVRDPVIQGEDVEGSDTTFDVQPSSGATTGIATRDIIDQESCASCHGTEEFAFHGGPRQDVQQCVSCHQKGAIDVGSGNTMDFRVMIHKIHTGDNLTKKPYEFCGFGCENFGAPPDDFSEITYPQSTMACRTCHDPADPETPDAIRIANNPTAQVCASCHDQLEFDETGLTNERRNHIGLAQPNSTCAACHSEDGLMISSLESHLMEDAVVAQTFQYNILSVTNSGEGQSPVVTFSITDPTNNDAFWDLTTAPAFSGEGTSLNMTFSWPTSDFTNVNNDAGTSVPTIGGRPYSVSIANSSGLRDYVIDNGDGTYTVDTSMLDTPVVVPMTTPPLGSGQVGMEGHLAADFDRDDVYADEIPVTNVVKAFAITDEQAQPRRVVVDVANCQSCHGVNDGLAFHGGNRTDEPQHCVSCHHPNATDVRRRPDDPDGIANGMNEAAMDGLEDQSIDFKYMIHALHAASIREQAYMAYGFGGALDGSHITYPRSPADCNACHVDDSFALPLGENVLATTIDTGATNTATGFAPSADVASDPTDDNNFSPEAAVCVACHDGDFATQHMASRSTSPISFGNGLLLNPDPFGDPDTQADVDMNPENCSFCHGPGGFVDVADVHGLNE